jgi:hypothetical protein
LAVDIANTNEGPEFQVLLSWGEGKIYTDDDKSIDGIVVLEYLRHKLNAGLSDALMLKNLGSILEALAFGIPANGQYQFIIMGALIMTTGAKIQDSHMESLREFASEVYCTEYHDHCEFREMAGFRGPGKRQFLAALDNYKPGTPRNFKLPSCYACGLTKADTGKAPLKCTGCSKVWFCNKVCHRAVLWIISENHYVNQPTYRIASGVTGASTSGTVVPALPRLMPRAGYTGIAIMRRIQA